MPTTSTLTDRYIAATVASLPPASQDDVRAELTASIGDAIDARMDQGEDAAAAERAVLTDLGDPGILAAGYADRPLQLIGPKYFLTWWRLLKLLWIIVPICAFGGVALAKLIEGAGIGDVVGTAIGVGISSIVHVAFWVTLVFVILERTGTDTGTGTEWTLEQLPVVQSTGTGRVDLIASIVMAGLVAGGLVWDRFVGWVRVDGEPVPLLDPQLWPWWIGAVIVLLLGSVVIAIVVFANRRWTVPMAIAATAGSVVFMSLALTALGRGILVNPAFVDLVFTSNGVQEPVVRILAILIGFSFVAFPSWSIADAWIKTAKDAKR